jgi:hypothetical protein
MTEMPDPEVLPTERLEHEITTLAAQLAAATCRWLLLVAELDRREAWLTWGARSCAHWLSFRCGIALSTAREQVRVAHALRTLPQTRSSFAEGRLSYSQVRAITSMATPETEADLVMLARHATGAQLERVARAHRRATSADEIARHERRSLRWQWDDDGMLVMHGRFAPEDGALVIAAIEAVDDASADASVSQRRADALVEVVRSAVGGEDDAAIPCEISVVVEAGANAYIDGGPALDPETLLRLACDAAIVRMVEGKDGELLELGRRSRLPNRAQRRAMRRRDGGCRFPGCESRRFVHAHHVDWWTRDVGATNLDVLVTLCRYHHRLVHKGVIRVVADPRAGFSFYRADGTPIVPGEAVILDFAAVVGLANVDEETIVPKWDGTPLDLDHAMTALFN